MRNHVRLVAKVLILLSVISFVVTQNRSFAQTNTQKIDELMTLYHKYGQFNGAVLIAEKGRVSYQKDFGFANLEWNTLNTPDTKFRN